SRSVAMPGVKVENGGNLSALSLAFKGERIKSMFSEWHRALKIHETALSFDMYPPDSCGPVVFRGQTILVDEAGNPLKKVEFLDDYDSKDEVAFS
ncbi:hypothetical protein Tco_1239541, partial [Tanacetum coccineum]